MIITHQSLNALRTNFTALFQRGYGRGKPFYTNLCTTVPSSSKTNTYGFLSRVPKMRKWVGPRVAQNLEEHAAIIVNDPYELTVPVNRDDIEDDNLGMYTPMMEDMGASVAAHPDDLVKSALQNGETNLCFDGTPFFGSGHVLGGQPAQTNLFTGRALNAANYAFVRAAMMGFVGDDGDPLDGQANLLVVPPQLEGMGRTILNAEMVADVNGGGTTNIWRNSAKLIVVPKLANEPTVWYVGDDSHAIKGLIFQQRQKPRFVSKTAETDDSVFNRREFVYGADCRDNVGYALWWLLARCKP